MEEKQNKDLELNAEEKEAIEKEFPSTEASDDSGELSETTEISDKSEDVAEATEEETDNGESEGNEVSEGDGEGTKEEETSTEEKIEEEADTTPSDETAVVEEETKTEDVVEDIKDTPEVEELKAKLADLEEEKQITKAINDLEKAINKNKQDLDLFRDKVREKVIDECLRYGVPVDMDIQEMKQVAPDKFNILQQILQKADVVTNEVIDGINAAEDKMRDEIIRSRAVKEMAKYTLTEEEAQETCNAFIRILREVGVKDFTEDIADKVGFAVARAKMIVSGKKPAEQPKVEEVKAPVVEEPKKEEPKVKVVKKDLEEFKDSAVVGEKLPSGAITKENVMEIYTSKTGKERLQFFAEHQDLIAQAYREAGGSKYTDNRRRY